MSENSIRPVVLGRKAWLFSDTTDGVNASMAVFSMVETAKANGLDPQKYLQYLLDKRPNSNMTDEELAVKGIDALENFIKEIGLPAKLRDIAELNEKQLREIAASCNISRGAYRQMTHEEILEILQECY